MLAVKVLSANEFLPNVFTRSLQKADAPIRPRTGIHELFRQAGQYRHFRPVSTICVFARWDGCYQELPGAATWRDATS
jgi:hypothetical protein